MIKVGYCDATSCFVMTFKVKEAGTIGLHDDVVLCNFSVILPASDSGVDWLEMSS